jgi:hypothetical protein
MLMPRVSCQAWVSLFNKNDNVVALLLMNAQKWKMFDYLGLDEGQRLATLASLTSVIET